MKWKDWLDILFPRYCVVCGKVVFESYERYLCISCYADLPLYMFSICSNSPVVKTFWGRCEVTYGSALLLYNSQSVYAQLIKEIKYRDRPDLGHHLGYLLGQRLFRLNRNEITQVDLLLPVPMTRKKQLSRGYNQAEYIAKGLATALQIRYDNSYLKRVKNRSSQTRKSRFDRWLNAKSVYQCSPLPTYIKHVAIIDDVLTTGATIESCIDAIRAKNDVKVSVFALGYTAT